MNNRIFKILLFLLALHLFAESSAGQDTKYKPDRGAIVGSNTGRYNNRPLYINNTDAFVLTGDMPIARLVKKQYLYGTFMLAVENNGKSKWLQQFDGITSRYEPGKMSWIITDREFPGLKIMLEILPMARTTGMAARLSAEGIQPGSRIIWIFGGSQRRKNQNLSWKLDVMGQPELISWGFVPEECKYNKSTGSGKNFSISLPDTTSQNNLFTVSGCCTHNSETGTGEASEWQNPLGLTRSRSGELPVRWGVVTPVKDEPITWVFEAFNQDEKVELSVVNDPVKAFEEGLQRTSSFSNRLKIKTPDPFLDAVAGASVAAVDGTWYPPVFVHGALQWNSRFPGWRTIFGGTMYGWHDRVREEAKFYIASQVTESAKKEAKADPKTLLTEQHPDSRFYGVGHIDEDQKFYDMQSQFFDQLVEEYRWTNDPVLLAFFRKALELHLIWMRDCFDPDDDGVYESYINVWPTDSQWYNGGGSAEETSYAYRGHLAARDMARNAGDKKAEEYHNRMLEKIRNGFFKKMWITEKGHSGSYREQGGHERLHQDPWLYSIFLPVDAGLTSPMQAVESVYYSEWALQNDRMPSGGRSVWTSNWVPPIWSIRELWPGDNYHLALSYFQAGLPDDAWDIFRGSFMHTAFNHLSPGNLGGKQGGIDFGDCVHTFTRTLVSGLFGYNPDYPNGRVKIAPRFPTGWDHASVELPDFKIAFAEKDHKTSYEISLSRAADIELQLPVQADEIKKVTVNGKEVNREIRPAPGRIELILRIPSSKKVDIEIITGNPRSFHAPEKLEGNVGGVITLKAADGRIIRFDDPQSVLENEKTENGTLTARLTSNRGYHTVFAEVSSGKTNYLQVYRIKVNDPEGDARREAQSFQTVPVKATWDPVDIGPMMNADVTTIYQQQYLSPRPNTVSARLGTDGYSPWTFWHWKSLPPAIKLDRVKTLLDGKGRLVTPQSVPFIWNSEKNNVAFTSLWDNYPGKMEFPVNKTGAGVYFLVCGSTNVMQCQIANAVIRLNYVDGTTDSLELIPPVNYWNLSLISSQATAPGQDSRSDYTAREDRFCMPARLPERVQLGENCRAMLLNLKMRKGIELKSVTLETLSQEVVVGLMGITLLKE